MLDDGHSPKISNVRDREREGGGLIGESIAVSINLSGFLKDTFADMVHSI
jgi:hypothetical protein